MKIYIITKDDYFTKDDDSGYHICAATTDPERAEILRRIYAEVKSWGNALKTRIEVFEDGENGKFEFGYCYDCETGEVTLDDYTSNKSREGVTYSDSGEIYKVQVRAEDKAHARKKAQDMIAKFKAKWAGLCC